MKTTTAQFFEHLRIAASQPQLDDFWRMQRDVRVAARNAHRPFRSEHDTRLLVDLLPLVFAHDMAQTQHHNF